MKLLKVINLLMTVSSLKYKTMSSHYLKCRKNIESINSKISRTSNGKTITL